MPSGWGGSKRGRYLKVTPEQVKAIKGMLARDEQITAIAKTTGLSRPTIYRVLENERRRSR